MKTFTTLFTSQSLEPLELGRIEVTPQAYWALDGYDVALALNRHRNHDWGIVHVFGWWKNDWAVREGRLLHSVYRSRRGAKFCIETLPDRTRTLVLLPTEV